VTVLGSDRVQGANFTVERTAASALPVRRSERAAVNMDWGFDADGEPPAFASEIEISNDAGEGDEETIDREPRNGSRDSDENGGRRGRRRRRRGRGGRDRGEQYSFEAREDESERDHAPDDEARHDAGEQNLDIEGLGDQPSVDDAAHADNDGLHGSDEKPNKRRRRGRRGGRRGRERGRETTEASADGEQSEIDDERSDDDTETADQNEPDDQGSADGVNASPPPAPSRRPRRVWDAPATANDADSGTADMPPPSTPEPETIQAQPVAEEAPPAASKTAAPAIPSRRRHETGSSEPRIERVVVRPGEQANTANEADAAAASAPQRKGWWQRKLSGE
jgi:ribonuclease E